MTFLSKEKNPKKIPLVFFGTSSFAEIILQKLISEKYFVAAVVTRADKAQGRKKQIIPSAIKTVAVAHKIPVLQPENLDDDTRRAIEEYSPGIIIVAEYGKIIPKKILDMPKFGCVNVHASLLPRYRGASPVQNTLLNGDKETGITIMLMDEGMDTGPILAQKAIKISSDEMLPGLMERLAREGASLLAETLPQWIDEKIEPKDQDASKATLCQLIEKQDGQIFWNKTTAEIYNMYRAFSPWPGIFCFIRVNESLKRLKLLRVRPGNPKSLPDKMGEVFAEESDIFVRTADGALGLEELQLEGKNPLEIREFLQGYERFPGTVLQ